MVLSSVTRAYRPLAALLAGLQTTAVPKLDVCGVALDSRRVTPGDLFLAYAGGRQHGLEHAAEAVARGAVAVAWDADTPPELSVPAVQVCQLARHASLIAARAFDTPSCDLFVTGITGTDGKTSCAHMLAQALDGPVARCGYMGTLGYGFVDDLAEASHTTPDAVGMQDWLARLRASGARAAALEVSSHALAQNRVQAVDFDVAVLTQVGRDHLDYHGDAASYAAAKRRLFDLPGLDFAVLNADDDYGRRWLETLPADVTPVAYGLGPLACDAAPAFVAVRDLLAQPQGLTLTIDSSWGDLRVESTLIGRFNAANLAAVLAVLLIHGIAPADAAQALARVRTAPGRMEQIGTSASQPLVVVDYAHTPNALEQALQAVCAHAAGRVYCVFGCGGERDRGKRALMGAAAARHADALWLTDDNPRGEKPDAIVADILAGIAPDVAYVVEHDRVSAISQAINAAQPGDVVLIAGKGHETWQQIGDCRREHDDRVAARRVLEAA